MHPFVKRLRMVFHNGRVSGFVTLANREYHFALLSVGGQMLWEAETGREWWPWPLYRILKVEGFLPSSGVTRFDTADDAERFCSIVEQYYLNPKTSKRRPGKRYIRQRRRYLSSSR